MSDLKKRTTNALLWDMGGSLSTHGVRFFISIFLARMLSPEDFGLIGMALVFINLSAIFVDVGFGAALIQRKKLDEQLLSTVFYYNMIVSLLIAGAFYFLAPSIAWFYDSHELTSLVRWLALGIPLSAITLVQVSILSRELRFKELSLRTFLAGLISGIVGVAMAYYGYGYKALIGQYLTASVVTVIVLWGASEWRPRGSFSWSSLRELSGFGRYIFYGKTLQQVLQQLDTLVVGKLFSEATLGFYTRARSLNQLLVIYTSGSINKVFFPVLSQLQDQPDELRRIYLRTVSVLAFLLFGLSGGLIFGGEAIIIGLFGEKWQPTVLIFQVLMLRAFNYPVNAVIVKTFLAVGKAKENFWHSTVRVLMQLFTLLFAWWLGFDYFLYSLVVVSYAGTLYNNIILSRLLAISLSKQLVAIYGYFGLFLVASILPYLLWSYLDGQIFFRAFLCVATFASIYLLLCRALRPGTFLWAKQQITQKITS